MTDDDAIIQLLREGLSKQIAELEEQRRHRPDQAPTSENPHDTVNASIAREIASIELELKSFKGVLGRR
jgi:hypothetical protein